jgi:2-keto-3-deoxy-L-fuconate dehydrogenase
MSGRLSNKRVLLTAAGAGIGRERALACAREGAEVVGDPNEIAAQVASRWTRLRSRPA